jgi:hypothetical protein
VNQPDHHHTAATGPAVFRAGPAAARIEAQLFRTAKGLEIRDPSDGLLLALWAYGDLCPMEAAPPGHAAKALHLTCRADPDACLTVTAPAMAAQLRRLRPMPPRGRLLAAMMWAFGAGVLLSLLAGLPAH